MQLPLCDVVLWRFEQTYDRPTYINKRTLRVAQLSPFWNM